MSGETEGNVSGWTVDTLKEHLEDRVTALKERLDERHKAQMEAIAKAEVAGEKRFDSVNEFRGQLTDQAATFVTRKELEAIVGSVESSLSDLKTRVDTSQGQATGARETRDVKRVDSSRLIAALGLVVAAIAAMTAIIIATR